MPQTVEFPAQTAPTHFQNLHGPLPYVQPPRTDFIHLGPWGVREEAVCGAWKWNVHRHVCEAPGGKG